MLIVLNNTTHKAEIDDEDLECVNRYNWRLSSNGYVVAYVNESYPALYLHKLLLNEPFKQVDHVNRNTLDNRKSNLRACTPSQNGVNKRKFNLYMPTSKYKGVRRKLGKYWEVAIRVNGKYVYGGRHPTEEQAALKANELYVKHFGEFAVLNVIC